MSDNSKEQKKPYSFGTVSVKNFEELRKSYTDDLSNYAVYAIIMSDFKNTDGFDGGNSD